MDLTIDHGPDFSNYNNQISHRIELDDNTNSKMHISSTICPNDTMEQSIPSTKISNKNSQVQLDTFLPNLSVLDITPSIANRMELGVSENIPILIDKTEIFEEDITFAENNTYPRSNKVKKSILFTDGTMETTKCFASNMVSLHEIVDQSKKSNQTMDTTCVPKLTHITTDDESKKFNHTVTFKSILESNMSEENIENTSAASLLTNTYELFELQSPSYGENYSSRYNYNTNDYCNMDAEQLARSKSKISNSFKIFEDPSKKLAGSSKEFDGSSKKLADSFNKFEGAFNKIIDTSESLSITEIEREMTQPSLASSSLVCKRCKKCNDSMGNLANESIAISLLKRYSLDKTCAHSMKLDYTCLDQFKDTATTSNVLKAYQKRRDQTLKDWQIKEELVSQNVQAPNIRLLLENKRKE